MRHIRALHSLEVPGERHFLEKSYFSLDVIATAVCNQFVTRRWEKNHLFDRKIWL